MYIYFYTLFAQVHTVDHRCSCFSLFILSQPDRVATLADSIESLVYQFTVIITVAGLMSRCGMEEGKLQTLPAVSRLSV